MKKIHLEYLQLLNIKKILILGANSSLAKEFIKIVKKKNFFIKKIFKKDLNFNKNYKFSRLKQILHFENPDIIVNFIGKFQLNKAANSSVLISNILPAWEIIKYYSNKKIKKPVNILILGSSAYKPPRKKYMLYAASKSGLDSLCKSAQEFFLNTNIKIKIYNPPSFGGKHLGKYKKKCNANINLVAKKVYKYIN